MNHVQFYQTAMGRDFFDRNIPALIKQLAKLNDNLEKLTELLMKKEETSSDRPDDFRGSY